MALNILSRNLASINPDMYGVRGTSGDDTLVDTTGKNAMYGYAGNDRLYGDAAGDFSGVATHDQINGGAGSDTLFGDAWRLTGNAVGGNDSLFSDRAQASGVGGFTDILYGDSYEMTGTSRGGNDYLQDYYLNARSELYGDAYYMANSGVGPTNSRGGDDSIYAQAETAHAYGDAYAMNGAASSTLPMMRGGNDTIGFSSRYGAAYGDAYGIQGFVQCGNDTIAGTCQPQWGIYGFTFYGDAAQAAGNGVYGGHDTLAGFWGNDTLVGDFGRNQNQTYCGNDRLLGGSGNDTLWGDNMVNTASVTGGADVFVFGSNSGQDRIMDFNCGSGGFNAFEGDRVDLTALNLTGIGNTATQGAGLLTSDSDGFAVLMLPNLSGYPSYENMITFHNVALEQISLSDFIL
jgi:Ca2+-binding RTX toxin-like protein